MDVVVGGVGHAHIDVAWLWTLSQTRQKVARTFSTALCLMEQYTRNSHSNRVSRKFISISPKTIRR